MLGYLSRLAVLSIKTPDLAAKRLLDMSLAPAVRWMLLALVSVATAIVTELSLIGADPAMAVPPIFQHPVLVAGFLFASLSGVSYLAAWMAPVFGGQGRMMDVMLLLSWLQALRSLAQFATTIVATLPGGITLSLVMSLAVSILGIWISVVFVNHALSLGSLVKALIILILTGLIVIVAFSVLWSLVAIPNMEAVAHV